MRIGQGAPASRGIQVVKPADVTGEVVQALGQWRDSTGWRTWQDLRRAVAKRFRCVCVCVCVFGGGAEPDKIRICPTKSLLVIFVPRVSGYVLDIFSI